MEVSGDSADVNWEHLTDRVGVRMRFSSPARLRSVAECFANS